MTKHAMIAWLLQHSPEFVLLDRKVREEIAEAAAKAITTLPDRNDEDDLDDYVITRGPYANVCPSCREKMVKSKKPRSAAFLSALPDMSGSHNAS